MKKIFDLDIPESLTDACHRGRLALLVYDMQVGIASQIKDSAVVIAKVRDVIAAARAVRTRIFFTRHMSLPREMMGAFQFRMAMAWQRIDDPSLVKPWFLGTRPAFPSCRS